MSKVDRFFRKKVEDVVLEPRSEAWLRLEGNLSKKNKGLIWFRPRDAIEVFSRHHQSERTGLFAFLA